MKKFLTPALAVIAVIAIVLCIVFAGQSGNKTELEGKLADLTKQLEEAKESAKTALEDALKEKDEAVAAAKEAGENALKEAQEAAEKVKAELDEKVAGLEKQLSEAASAVKEEVTEAVEDVKETVDEAVESATVMSHADYAAAELDTEVCVETYVQATQSWWDNKITIYAQSEDGAYFIYNAACSEEDAAKLVPGAKIRVKGFKAEWSGEVEITDGTIEFLDGDAFNAEAFDATDLLGKDELVDHQNEKVAFKGLTVEAQDDGAAFNYKNAENKTDDLYVRFSKDGVIVDFCVEFYLCGNDTDVYKAVVGLQVGDVVDIEGFLYWYNGANVHMTALTK